MSHISRYLVPVMLLFGLGAILYAWSAAGSMKNDTQSFATGKLLKLQLPEEDTFFPDVFITDPNGEDIKLTDIDADVLVVNVWVENCPPCVFEMPTLAKLQENYPENRLKVVTLNFDHVTSRVSAKKRLNALSDNKLPFYGAPNLNLLWDIQARGFPTTLIYNRDGKELARLEGDTDWASADALRYFDHLLE